MEGMDDEAKHAPTRRQVPPAVANVDTCFGRERHPRFQKIGWHPHGIGYAAVVLAGAYWEAGDEGRHRVEAGDVLVHFPFDAHMNGFGARASEVLNLPLPEGCGVAASGRVPDPDLLARAAERDVRAASLLLAEAFIPASREVPADWPDRLAAALRADHGLEIGGWARRNGLAPESVSRGFKLALGLSPARYRRRQRARAAWRHLTRGEESLAEVAVSCGFSDQAHMTHELRWLTGRTPGAWRAGTSNLYKMG